METTNAFLNARIAGNRVELLYRDAEGVLKKKSVPAEYVTYHPKQLDPDPSRNEKMLRAMREDDRVLGVTEDGNYIRARWRDKWERRDVCKKMRENGIPVLEGDVNPIRRLISDFGLGIARPRRLYFDIEVDNRHTFVQMRNGHARVLSWAAYDEDGHCWAAVLEEWTDESEKELLDAFWNLAELGQADPIVRRTMAEHLSDHKYADPMAGGYDQLIAWSGRHGADTFDFVVMEQRSKHCGAMPKDIERWCWLDHHDVFERMNKNASESGAEKQSLKLQAVGTELLGYGKDDFDSGRTTDAWEGTYKSRTDLVRYNLKDVLLMVDVEKKTGYIALFQTLCEACRVFPNTFSLYPTVQMDGFMLRLGAERNFHFKTKFYDKEEPDHVDEQFEGAFVLHPREEGIIYDVHVGDFASMYPSIIITFNMSPETKTTRLSESEPIPENWCRTPGTGQCFRTDKQGILAYAIGEMLRLRAYWRKKQGELTPGTPEWVDAGRRSNAYKVAANSFFGAMGNKFSRYFDGDILEAITQTGAWLLRLTFDYSEKEPWNFIKIYGDTDATMVRGTTRERFVQFVDWCNTELYPVEVKRLGCKLNHIKFENEKGFKRIVFLSAKKYVGSMSYYKQELADETSKPEVKGLEWKRGDANLMARKLQGEIIQLFHSGLVEKEQYTAATEKWRHKVLEETLDINEVKVSQSLGKELRDFAVKMKNDGTPAAQPAHVRVAKILEERGAEIGPGVRIEYFMKDHPTRTVLPAEDYAGECDRFYLWEDKVFPPTERLLAALFPEQDWKEMRRVRPRKIRKGKTRATTTGTELTLLITEPVTEPAITPPRRKRSEK